MTYDNICFAVNHLGAGGGIPVFRAVLLRVHCCFHKIPPVWKQHTFTRAGMLETPSRRFPNEPEGFAILSLLDRYITWTSLPNFSLSTNPKTIGKRQAVKEKEKTLHERLFMQCFKQCFFPCKIRRTSRPNPRRRLFPIQPPVEREKDDIFGKE